MSDPSVQLRCRDGHALPPGADWCQECGSPPAHVTNPNTPATGILLLAKRDADRQLLRGFANLDADRIEMLAEAMFDEARRIEEADGRTSKRLEDLKEAGTLLHTLRQLTYLR